MSKPIIWTSIAAVLVSSASLAASGWVIANERGGESDCSAAVPAAFAPALSTTGRNLVEPEARERVIEASAPEHAATEIPAEAKPEPALEPAVQAAPTELKIKRFVVASDVENREPVGPSSAFEVGDDRVFAFVEIANRSSHEGRIVLVFEKGAARAGLVELEIPADVGRWRTWGYTRGLREAGTWDVVVREQSTGRELARTSIELTSRGAPVANEKLAEQPVADGML